MNNIIQIEISKAKNIMEKILKKDLSDEYLFNCILLNNVFDIDYEDQVDHITDASNDGGIDFIYYDEEESKVVLCQCKYTNKLSADNIIAETSKMFNTVENFKHHNTGMYNVNLKRILQNAIDRLPDENPDNIEYRLYTIANLNIESITKKIENSKVVFPTEALFIYTKDEIEKSIQQKQETIQKVQFEKLHIDKPKNILQYESNESKGIMCNVLSTDIIRLYNLYAGTGLFDLNIRKYIRNTLVDNGIKTTLKGDRSNFWFLNNGITIACSSFDIDGNTIRLENFSIVNGAQTTTLIGAYKGDNTQEFYIPCKIVASKEKHNEVDVFFTKIAEATNSQKPIYARDLKSNTPEMIRLQRLLEKNNVYLEIKRGTTKKHKYDYSLKNDELGQIILSFVGQKPGTARSGKRTIFQVADIYKHIFKVDYDTDLSKQAFLLDLIKLNDDYAQIESKLKNNGKLTDSEMNILKNGKQFIMAFLGICYKFTNNDVNIGDLIQNPRCVEDANMNYGAFISNYKNDNYENLLEYIVKKIIEVITRGYTNAFNDNYVTSVSNFFKTNLRYYDNLLPLFGRELDSPFSNDLKTALKIFNR